jgi:hypothetical protein
VCSRDAGLRPSLMRAVGTDIAADGGMVTVYLARRQSRQLLQDIAATGHVAVVFSEPFSHQTVQLKSSQARTRMVRPEDRPVLARYLESMEVEIQRVGHPPEVTRVMLAHSFDDVVAVEFEPEQAFDQTPGPKAGAQLAAGGDAWQRTLR